MQNLTGRNKQTWLRANATASGVLRRHRRQGKHTNKLTEQLEQEISAAIRAALSMWLAGSSQATAESSSSGNCRKGATGTLPSGGAAEDPRKQVGAASSSNSGRAADVHLNSDVAEHNKQRRRSRGDGSDNE